MNYYSKSGKCEICKELKDLTKGIESNSTFKDRVEHLKFSSYPVAYVGSRDNLMMVIALDPKSYYLAIEEDSSLFMDSLAIALRKNCEYKKPFDQLYV